MSKKAPNTTKPLSPSQAEANLPEGWAAATLGEICHVNPGKPSRDELPDDAAVSFVPMPAVDAELGKIASPQVRSAGQVRKGFTAFRDGDVIVAKITPSMENGKAAVASSLTNGFGFGSTEFHVLRPHNGVLAEYILHFIRQPSFRAEAGMHMTGTAGQKRVPADFLRETAIPLPPTAEQGRIADELAAIAYRVTNLRETLQRVPTLLKHSEASFRLAGCTGQLSAEWRVNRKSTSDHGNVLTRIQEQRRAALAKKRQRVHPRFVDSSLPAVEDLPELPDLPSEWLWTSVGFAASRIQYGSSARSDASASNGIPNLGMQNIQSGRIDLAGMKYVERGSEEIPGLLLQPGDLLFNRTNSPELVGKAAVFSESMRAIFASYLVRVQLQPELAIPQFVCHWINSPWGRMWAEKVKSDGVSQSNINSTKLAEMPLPLPPLDEQIAICELLNRVLSLLQSVALRAERGLSQAAAIMKSCSQMAFSGLLVETEAAIAATNGTGYETGEQLLARIRSQPLPPTVPTRNSQEKSAVKSKESPRDALQRAVDAMPQRRFSFHDLRAKVTDDHDAIRDALFQLLDTPQSGVKQVFDAKTKTMMLERVSK